jgi:hypothetical protein
VALLLRRRHGRPRRTEHDNLRAAIHAADEALIRLPLRGHVLGASSIEAADYLCSRFIVHLVEGGHQLVARIVATIAGSFRRAPMTKAIAAG